RRRRMPARRGAGGVPDCATAGSAGRAGAGPARGRGRARSSPGRLAAAGPVARGRAGSPALRRERLFLAIDAQHVVHERLAAARLEDARALHQHLLALDEVLAPVPPDARVYEGVHPDRIARARLDAHPAVDALQGVDLVAQGELLDLRARVLSVLDVDALRRAGGGAEEARRAAHRAVGLEGQPVRSPVAFGVGLALLGI